MQDTPAMMPTDDPEGGGLAAIDARFRIAGSLGLAIVIVSLSDWWALLAAVVFAISLTVAFRRPLRATARRLLAVDGILVLVVLTLPFAEPGDPILRIGPVVASQQGLERALAIVAKANAVAMVLFALLGGLDAIRFARGLAGLRLPPMLVHLLLLVARYVEVIGRERRRLRQAMTARAFRPRTGAHGWQALGWLVGMVLVRAFERAERVHGAMRCRGFRGTLDLVAGGGRIGASDLLFAAGLAVAAGGLIGLERL